MPRKRGVWAGWNACDFRSYLEMMGIKAPDKSLTVVRARRVAIQKEYKEKKAKEANAVSTLNVLASTLIPSTVKPIQASRTLEVPMKRTVSIPEEKVKKISDLLIRQEQVRQSERSLQDRILNKLRKAMGGTAISGIKKSLKLNNEESESESEPEPERTKRKRDLTPYQTMDEYDTQYESEEDVSDKVDTDFDNNHSV